MLAWRGDKDRALISKERNLKRPSLYKEEKTWEIVQLGPVQVWTPAQLGNWLSLASVPPLNTPTPTSLGAPQECSQEYAQNIPFLSPYNSSPKPGQISLSTPWNYHVNGMSMPWNVPKSLQNTLKTYSHNHKIHSNALLKAFFNMFFLPTPMGNIPKRPWNILTHPQSLAYKNPCPFVPSASWLFSTLLLAACQSSLLPTLPFALFLFFLQRVDPLHGGVGKRREGSRTWSKIEWCEHVGHGALGALASGVGSTVGWVLGLLGLEVAWFSCKYNRCPQFIGSSAQNLTLNIF